MDLPNEELNKLTNEELIQILVETRKENGELRKNISNKMAAQMLQSSKKEQKNKKLNKIIDNSIQKKMAFSLFYLGIDYHGFEKQQNHHNTIEAHLFTALKKTMLIKEIESAFFYLIMIYNPLGFNRDYTRAGRTDKGVSAFSNVIALKVRTLAKTETKNQLNYVKIINCNLPEDIRIIAFAEVPDDFNARYHCTAREYRYYFVRNLLNVDKMKDACKNYIGEHDFRNFCKINPTNTLDFKRTMFSFEIEEFPQGNYETFDPRMKFYFAIIKGNSFLWHQIRCMIEVLFLIGNGFEKSEIILELLDIDKNPRRPSYAYAADFPLVLSNCYYEKLEFKYRLENNMNLYEQLRERLIKKNVESALYLTMLKYFSNISLNQYTELKTNETLLEAIMKDENERRKKRNIKPLMQKAAGNTLEQSISNLKGKDKEMYMQKLEKKMKYEEKIQNIINKNEEKP